MCAAAWCATACCHVASAHVHVQSCRYCIVMACCVVSLPMSVGFHDSWLYVQVLFCVLCSGGCSGSVLLPYCV